MARRFEGEAISSRHLHENIKLFRLFGRSKIDFGQFDPMFPLNAALDRNTIPLVCRLSA
jgi:hypothetical protein